MAKKKKLGIKHRVVTNKNGRSTLYVRISYNGGNTTFISPSFAFNPLTAPRDFSDADQRLIAPLIESDKKIFKSVRDFYEKENINFEATDFSTNDKKFAHLIGEAHYLYIVFIAEQVTDFLKKKQFKKTADLYGNMFLGEEKHFLEVIKELNLELYQSIQKAKAKKQRELADFLYKQNKSTNPLRIIDLLIETPSNPPQVFTEFIEFIIDRIKKIAEEQKDLSKK